MANAASCPRTSISLRIPDDQRALIDRAAEASGKDRTAFMLDAATREATTVLLDQRYFRLDDDAWATFTAVLDAPPTPNPRLKKLLATKAPWER